MKNHLPAIGLAAACWLSLPTNAHSADGARPLICGSDDEYLVRQLDSDRQDPLCETYRGKAMLVVNTASRCAYTDQYDDLERLYAGYRERGLTRQPHPHPGHRSAAVVDRERERQLRCRGSGWLDLPPFPAATRQFVSRAISYGLLTDPNRSSL